MKRLYSLLVLAVVVSGCTTGVMPDPNEPASRADTTPEILQRNLASIGSALFDRKARGTISDEQYQDLLAKAAAQLTEDVDLQHVDPAEAWRLAEVLRAARNWKAAAALLEVAVKAAVAEKDEDRRINDSLRLAQCLAHLGQTDRALAVAQSVMNARPADSAPILPAVLLEIAPPLVEHDAMVSTAKLLEQAVDKHLQTTVDGASDGGRAFLLARPFHVTRALVLAADLYARAGDTENATRVRQEVLRAQSDFRSFMRERQGLEITRT